MTYETLTQLVQGPMFVLIYTQVVKAIAKQFNAEIAGKAAALLALGIAVGGGVLLAYLQPEGISLAARIATGVGALGLYSLIMAIADKIAGIVT